MERKESHKDVCDVMNLSLSLPCEYRKQGTADVFVPIKTRLALHERFKGAVFAK